MTYQNYDTDLENENRQNDAIKRLNFYLDNTKSYIQDFLEDAFPEYADEMQPAFFNIVKKIINLKSTCYTEPAARTLKTGTKNDIVNMQTIERTMNLDGKFDIINKYTNLLKTVLIKSSWRNGQLNLDIFTPDILTIETGESYDDLIKVTITNYPPNSNDEKDITYSVWTTQSFSRLDYRGNVVSHEANPYKIMPFVAIHEKIPTHSFWSQSGADLQNAQESIYRILTDLVFTCKYQSYGINVFKNISNDGHSLINHTNDLDISPNSAITLTHKDSDFKVVSPRAPIKDIIEVINFIFNMAAVTNGLSAGHLQMKQNRQSGVSRQVAAEELREIRRGQIPTYRRAEQDLFNLSKIIWNYNKPGNKFSEACHLEINYPEIKEKGQNTAEQRANAWAIELESGITSPVEILMEKDPDLSRDQAIEKVKLLKQERISY